MSKVDQFVDIMREKGLNATYQRLLIYKHLLKTKSHPTAEAIYQEVKSVYPSLSLATVYKTLETFAENNLIAKVNTLHDMARFDGDTNPHHHLVCLHCKKIVDIYDDDLNRLSLPARDGFKISGYRVQFEGICEDCNTDPAIKKAKNGKNELMTFCGKNDG